MFLFRAAVPSTSLRAGPSTSLRAGSEAAGLIAPRTKDEARKGKGIKGYRDRGIKCRQLVTLGLSKKPFLVILSAVLVLLCYVESRVGRGNRVLQQGQRPSNHTGHGCIAWEDSSLIARVHDKVILERKRRFLEWYQQNDLPAGMNLQVARLGRRVRRLLDDYHETPENEIPFEGIVNRMCFWMATGSGKTLVPVKLIEVLRGLILAGEIPPNDILVLTHREDLIEQLKRHVQEFNSSRNDLYIRHNPLIPFFGLPPQTADARPRGSLK